MKVGRRKILVRFLGPEINLISSTFADLSWMIWVIWYDSKSEMSAKVDEMKLDGRF